MVEGREEGRAQGTVQFTCDAARAIARENLHTITLQRKELAWSTQKCSQTRANISMHAVYGKLAYNYTREERTCVVYPEMFKDSSVYFGICLDAYSFMRHDNTDCIIAESYHCLIHQYRN